MRLHRLSHAPPMGLNRGKAMITPQGCAKWIHQCQGWGSCQIWIRDNLHADDPATCTECPIREERKK